MADKPILFSGPMVRAILEGRKSATRRVVKPQPLFLESGGCWYPTGHDKRAKHYAGEDHFRKGLAEDFGPYSPGDTLWVRETWAYATGPNRDEPDDPEHHKIIYREEWDRLQPNCPLDGCWKPSIFMPRWASRINLRVTDVRVERIQEITEEDAIAEGVESEVPGCSSVYWNYRDNLWDGAFPNDHEARCSFQTLWDSINAKRGHPWSSNPWVWVYTFRRLEAGQ